jgi:hypothetical protein
MLRAAAALGGLTSLQDQILREHILLQENTFFRGLTSLQDQIRFLCQRVLQKQKLRKNKNETSVSNVRAVPCDKAHGRIEGVLLYIYMYIYIYVYIDR